MYLRRCYREKDGKRHAYWALVESYRTARGPRQRVVAWLSAMDEQGCMGVKHCAASVGAEQAELFTAAEEPQWVEVDLKGVRVERTRRFGGPWLGRTLLRQLELDRVLEASLGRGREQIPWPLMAMVLVLGRLCDPSSELQLAERFYEHSALPDLLGVLAEKVNEDRRYRALDALLPHKTKLEQHLRHKLGELFDLDYDLLLYDVTSTYFEGEAKGNPLAQRGYLLRSNVLDWTPGRALAGLHLTDRSRGRLSHSEVRFATAPGLAPEAGTGAGPHPGLLPGLRALENPGGAMPPGRPGRRTKANLPRTVGDRLGGCGAANAQRGYAAQTLHRPAQRAPACTLATARTETARRTGICADVVETPPHRH
jgi:hypothetical protein